MSTKAAKGTAIPMKVIIRSSSFDDLLYSLSAANFNRVFDTGNCKALRPSQSSSTLRILAKMVNISITTSSRPPSKSRPSVREGNVTPTTGSALATVNSHPTIASSPSISSNSTIGSNLSLTSNSTVASNPTFVSDLAIPSSTVTTAPNSFTVGSTPEPKKSQTTLIIAMVMGGLALLAVLTFGFLFVRYKRRNKGNHTVVDVNEVQKPTLRHVTPFVSLPGTTSPFNHQGSDPLLRKQQILESPMNNDLVTEALSKPSSPPISESSYAIPWSMMFPQARRTASPKGTELPPYTQ
ncbi:hypothetical protein FRC17_002049 [Serendipita sp. 399]|nr:hypothetical protein FRC17_002049 [Serendipita sp. 399]